MSTRLKIVTQEISDDDRLDLVLKAMRAPDLIPEICAAANVSEQALRRWIDAFLDGGRQALAKSENPNADPALDQDLYPRIVECFPGNLVLWQPDDGAILFRSGATEHTYGRRASICEHWASETAFTTFVEELKQCGRVDNAPFIGRKPDGTEFSAHMSARLIEYKDKVLCVSTSTNMNEFLKMSEQVGRANLRLNEAMEAIADGFILWDQDLKIVMYNDRLLEMLDLRNAGSLTGMTALDLQKILVKVIELPPGMSSDEALEGGIAAIRNYRMNFQIRTRSGRIIMLSTHRTKLDGYFCTFRDVTRRINLQKELDEQREIAHQNEKLSALGELLAGVAHELNNPLSVVTGYSLMLKERLQDPVNRKRIDRIAMAAERCGRIVQTFLAMARDDPADLHPLSLTEVIQISMETGGESLRSQGTKIDLDLDPLLPMVEADADQMIQVFSNLIANATHALNELGASGVLSLRTYFEKSRDRVTAEVIDNGPGVPTELRSRIFEPFFTTKDSSEGTGIGLAFCHRIIDSCGGEISVENSAANGARFIVRLPRHRGQHVAQPSNDGSVEQSCKAVRVLVVDDDVNVRDLLEDLLNDSVFKVETLGCAKQALRTLAERQFDIVLSDVRMPGMDGLTFYKQLIDVDQEYTDRFAFITGDLLSTEVADFFKEYSVPVLEKPVIPSELTALVNHLCEKMEGA